MASALLIDTFLSLGRVAFSVPAGVRLWRIAPNALRTAHRFLYTLFGFYLVWFLLIYLAFPIEFRYENQFVNAKEFIWSIMYVSFWLLYLKRSKRVAATYGHLS